MQLKIKAPTGYFHTVNLKTKKKRIILAKLDNAFKRPST